MAEILKEIGNSPALAWLGFVVVVAVLVAPIALRLAGLTGGQIVTLLRATLDAVVLLVKELRAQNNDQQK